MRARHDPPTKRKPDPSRAWGFNLFLTGCTVVFFFWLTGVDEATRSFEVSYSDFKALVEDGRVEELTLRGLEAEGRLREAIALGPEGEEGVHFKTRIPAFGNDAILESLEGRGVDIVVEPAKPDNGWLPSLLLSLPLLILMGFVIWNMRNARNLMGGPTGHDPRFSKPRTGAEVPEVRFSDVAGQIGAKREVQELVDFLRDPHRFTRLGAEVPRGVLLMGPPGTGKTLLARALAGEAGVPFFSVSASEFIEVFVGVGASRVRQLFEAARKSAPSIIFIDELDSIGRTRGTGLGGGHDEREQTLNQILAEMDGFSPHEAVIMLAATNRPDVLDPALLRPGRFDRHVVVDLPDRNDRTAILTVHTKNIPMDETVNLEEVASGTPGFSGADLKNLVNEAALAAAQEAKAEVGARHIDTARDKVLLGTERRLAIEPAEKHRLAVHEAGHTVVANFLPNADPPYKVSIIPRGRALGGTQQLAEAERHTLPEEYLRDRLAVLLGGRTAERELLGTVSSGADDDIHQASQLARAMVARWGMSPSVGPIDLRDSEDQPFLGREMAQPRRLSESSASAVDAAVHELVVSAEASAAEVIRDHRAVLRTLIRKLEAEEVLDRDQIKACLHPAAHLSVAESPRLDG